MRFNSLPVDFDGGFLYSLEMSRPYMMELALTFSPFDFLSRFDTLIVFVEYLFRGLC
jgi:hypothetical protein